MVVTLNRTLFESSPPRNAFSYDLCMGRNTYLNPSIIFPRVYVYNLKLSGSIPQNEGKKHGKWQKD